MRTIDGDAFSDWLKEYGQEYIHGKKKISLMYIWKHVQDMPTIEPERKKGKWIDYSDEGFVECPFCHSATNCDGNKEELHFCFSCGADMRGE